MRFECRKCKIMSKKIADKFIIDPSRINKLLPNDFYESLLAIKKYDWFESFNDIFDYSEAVNFLKSHIGHPVYFVNV